jgi:predicted RNase H-like HicB family nuclease
MCVTVASVWTFEKRLQEHEDGNVAEFPALRGCCTWERTHQEAVRNAQEGVGRIFESAAAFR